MDDDIKKLAEMMKTPGVADVLNAARQKKPTMDITSFGITPEVLAATQDMRTYTALPAPYGRPMEFVDYDAERQGRLANAQYARDNPVLAVFDELQAYIESFQAALDPDKEVGAQLVNFGRDVKFHITHVGYALPSLIHFDGVLEDGSKVKLVQNITQLSVLFIAMPVKTGETRRPIGFIYPEEDDVEPEGS